MQRNPATSLDSDLEQAWTDIERTLSAVAAADAPPLAAKPVAPTKPREVASETAPVARSRRGWKLAAATFFLFVAVALAATLLLGCATTSDVNVTVPPTQAARVPSSAAAVAKARAAADEAAQALAAAQAEWSRAVEASRAAHIARADSPELAAVGEAQRRHGAATVAWRAGVTEMMRWRSAAAQASVQLEIALFLARTGDEIDLGSFQRQQAQLQRRHAAAIHHVVELHAGVDSAEHALADAKERYAASRRAAPALLVAAEPAPDSRH
ncbi:MAG TPA: hypothetical protein VGL86_04155 [Polyangia bacterium]|jgi:hypothetical protein